MKMLSLPRFLIVILILGALIVGLGTPVVSTSASPGKAIELARNGKGSDDPPWDPGDESASLKCALPSPTLIDSALYNVKTLCGSRAGVILAKKGDNPWDPGDESPMRSEARHG